MEHLPFEKRLEQVGFTQPGERMSVGKPVCHLAAGEANLHIWGGQQEYAAELFIAVSSTRTRGKRQKLRREVQTLFPHKKKLFPHKKKKQSGNQTGCAESLHRLHPGRFSRHNWRKPCVAWSDPWLILLWAGSWIRNILMVLPTRRILLLSRQGS